MHNPQREDAMRTVLALALIPYLAGCSLGASVVKSDSFSYDEVIEDTTNKLLLANVLRARDKAPLHFSELPKISESIKAAATVGAKFGSEYSRSPGISYEVDPSFDLSHVNSKDFVTGIASPIDPKFVKYWRDRGLDQRVMLFLFFSSADITEETTEGAPPNVVKRRRAIHVFNSPRMALDREADLLQRSPNGESHRDCPPSEFARYLRLINNLELIEVPGSAGDNPGLSVELNKERPDRVLSALAAFDASKYKVECNEGKCTLKSASKVESALCYKSQWYALPPGAQCGDTPAKISTPLGPKDDAARSKEPPPTERLSFTTDQAKYCEVYNRFVPTHAEQATGAMTLVPPPNKSIWMELNIRSVGEVIQYVGDVVALEEYLAERQKGGAEMNIHTPLTLGYCEGGERDEAAPGCGDFLFRVDQYETEPRFTMEYRHRDYSIAPYASADRRNIRDHSIEVLGVLNQLIGLHREAKDIQSTQSVLVVP